MVKTSIMTAFYPRGGGKLFGIKLFDDFDFFKKFFKLSLKPQKTAFTLAETLITIGMIGVVAALTLPTLMSSTNDKEIVAKVKKNHSMMNEAYSRAVAKYGPMDTWDSSITFTYNDIPKNSVLDKLWALFVLPAYAVPEPGAEGGDPSDEDNYTANAEKIGNRVFEFMQVEKLCKYGAGCFLNSTAKTLENGNDKNYDTETNYYKAILSDGTSVGIGKNLEIVIDIDGPKKGKNTLGSDLFVLKFKNSLLLFIKNNLINFFPKWVPNGFPVPVEDLPPETRRGLDGSGMGVIKRGRGRG